MRRRTGAGLVAWRLALYQPRRYFGVGTLWILYFTSPLATGLVLNLLFDELSAPEPSRWRALSLCGALVAVEACRGGLLWIVMSRWARWWQGSHTLLQTNVLRSLVGRVGGGRPPGPAAGRLPGSPGDAANRCRDDVDSLTLMTDNWIDVGGGTLFAGLAFGVMVGIDPVIALVLMTPPVLVMAVAGRIGPRLEELHRRARRHGAEVTAFIGEVFTNVLTIKSSDTSGAVGRRLRLLGRRRRDAAVRDSLGRDVLSTAAGATGDISLGLVLLLAAPALQRGALTVGELALFTAYVGWLTQLPRTVAEAFYHHRQGRVATERLTGLLTDEEDGRDLVRHRPIWTSDRTPAPDRSDPDVDPVAEPLDRLEIEGLTVTYARGRGTDRVVAVHDVDLRLDRGSLTVVTGAVGAGKTTLLRALLGLVAWDGGTMRWNDRVVPHPELQMVPPRAAYVAQVPRLLSDTLAANLLMGRTATDDELPTALHVAALEDDVAAMPDGLATVIGSRGTRLSGGQAQRVTAARALMRRPDLLVVDDLSSALDVETEQVVWDRLAAAAVDGTGPTTLLVVSHRRAVLDRADRIVVMDGGRIVPDAARGTALVPSPSR